MNSQIGKAIQWVGKLGGESSLRDSIIFFRIGRLWEMICEVLFLGVISGFLGVECKRESGPHLSNFFEGCVQGFGSSSSPSTKIQLGL